MGQKRNQVSLAGDVRCPHCDSTTSALLFSRPKRGRYPELTVLRCGQCGLAFLSQWSSEFVAPLYDYYAKYADRPRESLYELSTTASQQRVLRSLSALVQGRRLLDVGCGLGQFVATASDCGWDARGIDLADTAIATAQRLGSRCDRIDFFSSELQPNSFDVVIMSEFIEHVSRPGRFLARAEEVLAAGGVLYLTTPNFDSLQRFMLRENLSWIHPEHWLYFDPASMRRVFADSTRFELLSLHTKNLSISHMLYGIRSARGGAESAECTSNATAPSASTQVRRSRLRSLLSGFEADRRMRAWFTGSSVGNVALTSANRVLSAMGVGDSLVVVARKR